MRTMSTKQGKLTYNIIVGSKIKQLALEWVDIDESTEVSNTEG
jgi:hypothetical protein